MFVAVGVSVGAGVFVAVGVAVAVAVPAAELGVAVNVNIPLGDEVVPHESTPMAWIRTVYSSPDVRSVSSRVGFPLDGCGMA